MAGTQTIDGRTIAALLRYRQLDALSIDSAELTIARWDIIRKKAFLKKIYDSWYAEIASAVPPGEKPVLEIGSGSGFMKEFVPEVICSDILPLPNCDLQVDACTQLPFEDASLRAIVANNTFHHLPDVSTFLQECNRVLAPGGVLSMIEPWVTPWSSLIYRNLHSEPFIPGAKEWQFPTTGPLSGANGALPWIVFERDREVFERQFPDLRVSKIKGIMPISYILSGGVSMRNLVPNRSYEFFRTVESALEPLMPQLAMFAHIVVSKLD